MGTRLRVMVSVAFVAACTALVLVAIPAAAQNGGGGNGNGGNGGGDAGQGAIDTSAGGNTGSNAAAESDPSVLKVGWAQDPNTLNPFVGQDEEDYTVWAMNWDLPINFSPKDLSPTSGIIDTSSRPFLEARGVVVITRATSPASPGRPEAASARFRPSRVTVGSRARPRRISGYWPVSSLSGTLPQMCFGST